MAGFARNAGTADGGRLPVLVLALDFPPAHGGVQSMLGGLCQHLRRMQPWVIAPAMASASVYDSEAPYPVTRVGVPGVSRLGANPAVVAVALAGLRIARHCRPQYVFAGHLRLAPAAALLSRIWQCPYGVAVYGREVGSDRLWPLRVVQSWALRRAHRVVAISAYTAARAIRCGARPATICRIAPGVDRRYLEAPADPSPAWRWVGDGRPVLLTVARLAQRHKGHDTVIRALPAIARAVPDVVYVIAGSGPLEAPLRGLASRLGVAGHVVFTGAVSEADLLALYDRCDVFVMPSRATADGDVEGFGIVFLEAAARGKPVIAARAGGVADAVVHGETGVVLEEASPARVAAAASELLTNRARSAALGAAGARRALDFAWPRVAARFEDCLLGG